MRRLKAIAKRIPGVPALYHKCVGLALRARSTEDVFTGIFRSNKWGGKESVSGLGSDVVQAQKVIHELSVVIADFNIRTLLDIPCGDFHWMRRVKMDGIDYTGADIVAGLIQRNINQYESNNVHFRKLNLLEDRLPPVDLIFCRDCLVHFSYEDIVLALRNICRSESTYLLTTTFTARQNNRDIATGQWRPLNMEVTPVALPAPLKVINEGCTEGGGAYKDKSLGLWKITDIKASLARRSAI